MQHDMEWSDCGSFSGFSSDMEQSSTSGLSPKHCQNDYLLGMKILEYCIMRQAFDNVNSTRDDFDLNVAFADEASRFPYWDCLQHAIELLGDEYNLNWCTSIGNNSAGLATVLGTTYRLNVDSHAKVLLLVESKGRKGSSARQQIHTVPRARSAQSDVQAGRSIVEDIEQLPRYAMRLNEYARSQDFRIKWDESELSMDPPKFRAATRIDGATFEGMASNKKTARHLAAKQACIAFGIPINTSNSTFY